MYLAQADPRANVINGQVVWQPPLSIFDSSSNKPSVFSGDQQFILTPNQDYRQADAGAGRST
jgi:hypothetical protein